MTKNKELERILGEIILSKIHSGDVKTVSLDDIDEFFGVTENAEDDIPHEEKTR